MPELPEVETIRLLLQSHLIGKTIKDVAVIELKQFTGNKLDIIDKKVDSIVRKGKVVSIKTPIKRIKQGGQSSFYCPHCQPMSFL